MKLAVVIPATAGRERNLELVLDSIDLTAVGSVIVVDDGGDLAFDPRDEQLAGVELLRTRKHEPGREQPRNIGARWAKGRGATHVWFIDSDVMVTEEGAGRIVKALNENGDRVLVAPYDWLAAGLRPGSPAFWIHATGTRNDPRWPMFRASPPEREYVNDASAGLACWSGNLVWPISEFERLGGFWSELHHGRCEDGELGLRAVAMGVPISFIAAARGYHLHHPVNTPLILERNARDVPMLNARHAWLQRADILLTDRDGAAFDVRCACGEVVPTVGWWAHAECCPSTDMELPA